ncbi:uncharacterized protein Gm57776 isoform X3 [Mus musculus]|uniref:uncharacterized protein Gm57776 isoform X3 n=1 Tax=Mus musculus TaxID=10090 RepID=UPI0016778E21|nr:uncharacterized protein LOC118567399 isoform X3 [Mus musculus]
MGGSGNVHPQPKVYQLDLSMQAEVEERVQAMVERSSLLSQRLVSTGQVSSGLHSSLPVSFAPVPPPTYSQEASLLLVETVISSSPGWGQAEGQIWGEKSTSSWAPSELVWE